LCPGQTIRDVIFTKMGINYKSKLESNATSPPPV